MTTAGQPFRDLGEIRGPRSKTSTRSTTPQSSASASRSSIASDGAVMPRSRLLMNGTFERQRRRAGSVSGRGEGQPRSTPTCRCATRDRHPARTNRRRPAGPADALPVPVSCVTQPPGTIGRSDPQYEHYYACCRERRSGSVAARRWRSSGAWIPRTLSFSTALLPDQVRVLLRREFVNWIVTLTQPPPTTLIPHFSIVRARISGAARWGTTK